MRISGLPTLEARKRDVGVDGDAAIRVGRIDLRGGGGDRVFHHHQQGLRVEGYFSSRNLVENWP